MLSRLNQLEFRIVIIYRQGKPIVPDGNTVILKGDEVFIVSDPQTIKQLLLLVGNIKNKSARSIMIAGGGQIGIRLALALENKYQIKLIEMNPARAKLASETLKNSIVLQGDAADEELLVEENIEHMDMFCALTNADEANIISSMLAKRLGAQKVMALINRAAYVDLVQSDTIDIAISPQQATIGSLLAHIRKGDVVVVHSLRRGAAEAIEAIAHGDASSSNVVGKTIAEIDLPPDTSIGAVVRDGKVIVANSNISVEAEDHVILLVADKRRVPEVESLFQVGITFL